MREFGKKIVGGQNAWCREGAGKAESLGMAEDSYFRVDGADLQSGKEIFLVIAAGSSDAAEEAAREKGLLVSSVRRATQEDRDASNGQKAPPVAAPKSPFSNEAMPAGAPPMKKWFPGTLSNTPARIPPRTLSRDGARPQQINNVARSVIPPAGKPAPSAAISSQPQKRPGGPPPTIPKPVKKAGVPVRPRPVVTPSRGIPPIRMAASAPPAPAPPPAKEPATGPISAEEKPAASPSPADVEPVVAPSPVIPVLDAPTLLELPKEKAGVVVPPVSAEAKPIAGAEKAPEVSPAPEPLSPGFVFQVSPSSGVATAAQPAERPPATSDAGGSEAAMARIASLIAAEVPMPLPEASFAPARQAEPIAPAQAQVSKAVAAPEPVRMPVTASPSVEAASRSRSGNWVAVVFLAPLAFLSLAGGVFVLAYVLSRTESPDLSEIQRVDFHIQALTQSFLGGMLVLAGLLLFVAAGLVYVGSALRSRRQHLS